jgi:hypothetical protein
MLSFLPSATALGTASAAPAAQAIPNMARLDQRSKRFVNASDVSSVAGCFVIMAEVSS